MNLEAIRPAQVDDPRVLAKVLVALKDMGFDFNEPAVRKGKAS